VLGVQVHGEADEAVVAVCTATEVVVWPLVERGEVWGMSLLRVNGGVVGTAAALGRYRGRNLVAVARGHELLIVEWPSGELVQQWSDSHDHSMVAVTFNPRGTQVLTASLDDIIRCFDVADGRYLWACGGHEEWATVVTAQDLAGVPLSSPAATTGMSLCAMRPLVSLSTSVWRRERR
jgi:hypothetical protein